VDCELKNKYPKWVWIFAIFVPRGNR